MSILDQLPHECSIGRVTRVTDALGANMFNVEVEQTGVECWQQQASASEVRDFEKRGIRVTTKIFFIQDPMVTERHRILVTKRNGVDVANTDITDIGNSDCYDVKSITLPDASAGLDIVYKVMCDRSTGITQ